MDTLSYRHTVASESSADLARALEEATSKGRMRPAALALADGTVFFGRACGASGEALGEICFNTSLEGYLEIITDPSYAGQIVALTYPQIGNYGVALADAQAAHPALRGLVVADLCAEPSNWRSDLSLGEYLRIEGVIGVEGIDTRALVRRIRSTGAQAAVISTTDLDPESLRAKAQAAPSIAGENLVRSASCETPRRFVPDVRAHAFAQAPASPARRRVVAYHCGVKRSILEGLARAGCEVTVVPWDMPADDAHVR